MEPGNSSDPEAGGVQKEGSSHVKILSNDPKPEHDSITGILNLSVEPKTLTDAERKTLAIGMQSLKVPSITAIPKSANTSSSSKEPWTFKGIIEMALQPSIYCRISNRLFRSNDAIENEVKRQRENNRYIIHPLSPFRASWDMVMVVILAVTLVILPIEIAFYQEELSEMHWKVVNILLDSMFLLDIVLNFRTAFVHSQTEEVVLDNKRIVSHYLFSWFLPDLLSSIPFDYIYMATTENGGTGDNAMVLARTLRALRLTKLLSLLRIFRVVRLLRYVHKLEEYLKLNARMMGIVNLVLVILVFTHWNGCCQYLVAFLQGFPEDSWVVLTDVNINSTSRWAKYTLSVFRSMSHMVSVGYGTVTPKNIMEIWMTMLSIMFGASFYAVFIAHMSAIIMTLDSSGRHYEERVAQVKEYMRFRRVPMQLQHQVLDYYEHRYQKKFFDEKGILHEKSMSYPMRKAILMHNCRNLVEKVPFLSNSSPEFLVDIITKLQLHVFFPGDCIISAGKRGDGMFFLESGRVEIQLPSGQVVNELGDGSHFGEISLLLDERRVASVAAVEICDIYYLSKKDFDEVLADYPKMRISMEETAKARLESIEGLSFAKEKTEIKEGTPPDKKQNKTKNQEAVDSTSVPVPTQKKPLPPIKSKPSLPNIE